MDQKQIEEAAQIIRNGGLVAFPTETVYGLGANALNPFAVAKIFELKERPSFDPLIVHIADFNDLQRLTDNPSEDIFALAKNFWPGPLTIVLPKSKLVPDIVTSGLQTVGIRMPNNEIALTLIEKAGCPIAAPSANKFGKLSPVSAKHVRKQLPNVDFILDGGTSAVGIESTIISIEGNVCKMLRPGIITAEEIQDALSENLIFSNEKTEKIVAPGLLKSHYSPVKPLYIIDGNEIEIPKYSGVILHGLNGFKGDAQRFVNTSKDCNHYEIAANLFSALHEMEEDENIKQIFIEAVNCVGLGIAIMDRINKAAYQYQQKI
ncbi:L-threonylcarbamoyladenylate synthase [Draconibacterium sp.]|jgi:L-threonylcarbamoyladenylate synthase